jgi:hypothetical protein
LSYGEKPPPNLSVGSINKLAAAGPRE